MNDQSPQDSNQPVVRSDKAGPRWNTSKPDPIPVERDASASGTAVDVPSKPDIKQAWRVVLLAILNSVVAVFRGLWRGICGFLQVLKRASQRRASKPHTGKVKLRGEFRNDRLQGFADGKPLPPVPLRLKGGLFGRGLKRWENASVKEGDELEIEGKWKKKQYVMVKRIVNHTTGLKYPQSFI